MTNLWNTLLSKVFKATRTSIFREEDGKNMLYKQYEETDEIPLKALVLDKLLIHRIKHFEAEIAKSEQYPHEVDWDEIGDEMFNLLITAEDMLSTIVCRSSYMQDFLSRKYRKELDTLQRIHDQYTPRKNPLPSTPPTH